MCRPNGLSLLIVAGLLVFPGCPGSHQGENGGPHPTPKVLDEALQAHRDAASFHAADEDYYHDMDGGLTLTPSQVVGRNNWVVWTAGNDHLWDVLAEKSVGNFDLLKTISSYH